MKRLGLGTPRASRIAPPAVLALGLLLLPAGAAAGPAETEPSIPEAEQLLADGRFADAEETARRLLAAAEREEGESSAAAAAARHLLLQALWKGGKAAEPTTAELARRAVALAESRFGASGELARALWNAGAVEKQAGRARDAVPLLERAVALAEEHDREPPQTLLADCLNELGSSHYALAHYETALDLWRRALALRRRDLDPGDPGLGETHANLALALQSLQRQSEAREHFERALALQLEARPDHYQTAVTLNNFGNFLFRLGDLASARRVHEQALGLRRRVLPPDHPHIAMSLNNLALVLRSEGDPEGAARLYEEALRIGEKNLGAGHPETAATRNNLGNAYKDLGQYERAARLHRENVQHFIDALGEEHPIVASSLENLGESLYFAGRAAEAEPYHRRAFEIRRSVYGGRDRYTAQSLVDLAYVARALDRREEALELALEAEAISREVLTVLSQGMVEREALSYASWRTSGLPVLLSLAAEGLDAESCRRVWESLVATRAVVLDQIARRNRMLRARGDAETAKLLDEYATAVGRLAEVALGRGAERVAARDQRAAAQRRKEDLERRLAARSAFLARSFASRDRPGIAELAAALPEDAALVAYVRYLHQLPPAPAQTGASAARRAETPRLQEARYLAFVLPSRSSPPAAVPLGPARAIDDGVRRWRAEATRRPDPGGAAEAERRARSAGEELARLVWQPVAERVQGTAVFLVPDGALHLVSWAALPSARGASLLEAGPVLHYLSAERDLFAEGRAPAGRSGEGLLVLGDPSFDGPDLFAELREAGADLLERLLQPAVERVGSLPPFRGQGPLCEPFAQRRFAPLPGTGAEARAIARLWRDTGAGAAEVVHLAGLEASETNLKAAAPGRRIVHLATHGFFLGGVCASALGGDGRGTAEGEDPLLLSGLALAGANQRAAAGAAEDDGVLTAGEIAALDLAGVEWVVLSGCDTGVGTIRAGEGVLGLRRALEIAGARTTIMSLWPVEDEAAREWMEALYRERLERGRATYEAVRQATLEVLRRRRARGESTHPFYWAGFVAAGDWR